LRPLIFVFTDCLDWQVIRVHEDIWSNEYWFYFLC
jgi:hypothetical protein